MRSYGFLLDFLRGSSWAFVLVGSWLTFRFFIVFSLSTALLTTFLFLFFSLFIVATISAFIDIKQNSFELQEQRKMLEELLEKNKEEQ